MIDKNDKGDGVGSLNERLDYVLLSAWDRFSRRAFFAGYPFYTVAVLIVFFVVGTLHWLLFFDFARLEFSVLDWPKEICYLRIIKQSIESYELPFYISGLFQQTNLFLALPETLASPQVFLLRFMSAEQFMVANVLILFSVGFVGSVLLAKELKFTPAALFIYLILFNFNGYIVSHIAVGHSMWLGYFVLPFFALIVVKACRAGSCFIRLGLYGGVVLFFMLLQGAFHMWIWCLLFLFFLAIANRDLRGFSLIVVFSSAFLGFFRLLPAAVFLETKSSYISGYPSFSDSIAAFTQLRGIDYPQLGGFSAEIKLYWWEYDVFIGLVGFGFLIWFGVYRGLIKHNSGGFKALRFPILCMVIIANADVWWMVAELPIPLVAVERVSSRFICIPVIFLIIVSCSVFSNWKVLSEKWATIIASVLSVNCFFELMQHSHLWSIRQIEIDGNLEFKTFDYNAVREITAIPGNNSFYEYIVVGSFVVSLVSVLIVISFLIWTHKGAKLRSA